MGNYHEAITEYKRFIFLCSDSTIISYSWREIARLYQYDNKFEEAQEALQKALNFANDDSLKAEIRIDMGINFLAANDLGDAEFKLAREATFTSYSQIRRRAYFFLGVCYLYRQKWDEALNAFHSAFDSVSSERHLIDSLLNPKLRPRKLSPELAHWLSTFIPGAGQIYAGDWRNGINALLLNCVTGYLTVQAILKRNIGDALLTYFPLFYRYYSGNYLKAQEIATSRNEINARCYSKRILTAITDFPQ